MPPQNNPILAKQAEPRVPAERPNTLPVAETPRVPAMGNFTGYRSSGSIPKPVPPPSVSVATPPPKPPVAPTPAPRPSTPPTETPKPVPPPLRPVEPPKRVEITTPRPGRSWGPIIGVIVIVLILIIGGLYLWGRQLELADVTAQTTEEVAKTKQPLAPSTDAAVKLLDQQSASDEMSAIEADVKNTDLDNLDAELRALVR